MGGRLLICFQFSQHTEVASFEFSASFFNSAVSKKKHTHIHMYMSVFPFLLILTKKRSLDHVRSLMCAIPSLRPSTMVERSFLEKV